MTRNHSAVWREKLNRWQVNVQKNGKRMSFYSSTPGRAGKAEANRKADDWLTSQLIDTTAPASEMWKKWAETLVSKDAIKKAESFWRNHVSAAFGKKQVAKLTEGDLQAVIDRAAAAGLAWKSLSNIRETLAAFVKWLRKNKYAVLEMDDIAIPKTAVKGKKIILQPDDIVKIWAAPETLYSNLFKLALLTGLRPGELLGLRWEDVSESVLRVRRAINYDGVLTDGKNENAERAIWMSEYELSVLDAQREALKRRRVISPWIFPQPNGEHASQRAVTRGWKRFAKAASLTPGVVPYGWRHTFVSINNEMPEGLKQRRVGHSKNMDTEGVYGHAVSGEERQAAEYVKNRFDAILRKNK